MYQCDAGYNLVGNSSVICQANGEWSSKKPVCVPVDCRQPETILNGFILNKVQKTTFQSKIEYQCNIGYKEINDLLTIECLVSWKTLNIFIQIRFLPVNAVEPFNIMLLKINLTRIKCFIQTVVMYIIDKNALM